MRIDARVRAALLLAITGAGAWLRLRHLGVPSLWLDEILNVELARGFFDRTPFEWAFGFESENGPLYYLLQAIWLGVPAPLEVTFRLSPVILGILAPPLLGIALRPLGERIALVAAALLAVSPIHVFYSREGRPYAALVFLSVLLLGALVGRGRSGFANAALVVPFLAAATAATAGPLLLASGAIFLVLGIRGEGGEKRMRLAVAAAHGLSLGYLAFVYFRFERNDVAAGFPRDLAGTLERLVTSLLAELFTERAPVSALLLVALLLLVAAGAALMARSTDGRAIVAAGAAIAAVTIAALALTDHWVSPRYFLPALPALLAALAAGIDGVGSAAGRRVRRRERAVAIVTSGLLTLMLATPLAAIAREDALWKADWRSMVATLVAHAQPGDDVVAADGWVAHSLRHHLAEAGSDIRVIDVGGSAAKAEPVVGRRPRVWLMSGGYGGRGDAADWMRCRFYLVASEPVEDLRLYYAPGLRDFLHSRATSRELERLARGFQEGSGGRFELGVSDEPFLEGWYGPDTVGASEVRWARERSSIIVPRWPSGSFLRFEASPVETPMEMIVFLDGIGIGSIALREAEAVYEMALPDAGPGLLRLELSFSRTVRPADITESTDERPLSVLFNWIEFAPARSGTPTAGFAFRPDRGRASREPRIAPRDVPPIEPGRLRVLLQEAGYDPDREIPRLRERRADLVDLIADAVDAVCGSDEEFVRRLYLLVMNVLPDEQGTNGYVARLRRGASREQIIDWMLEAWALPLSPVPSPRKAGEGSD